MAIYNTNVRFNLVDLCEISCKSKKSDFNQSQLNELAAEIINTGVLLKPIILTQTSPRTYEVSDGNFSYHASIIANKIDVKRDLGGMVSAFVMLGDSNVALRQVKLSEKSEMSPAEKYEMSPAEKSEMSRADKAALIAKLAAELA